jgi:hypothetical protein
VARLLVRRSAVRPVWSLAPRRPRNRLRGAMARVTAIRRRVTDTRPRRLTHGLIRRVSRPGSARRDGLDELRELFHACRWRQVGEHQDPWGGPIAPSAVVAAFGSTVA